MGRKIMLGTLACLSVAGAAVAGVAHADGENYGKSWESSLLGAKVNGYVQIRGSYDDGGRHAQRGYQRFTRPSGPSLDTGRMYTDAASSPEDAAVHSRTDSVWDSPLWGDEYVTSYNWGVDYF